MASVPKSYPTEPGANRCGDTYKKSLTVNGEIPGTDFGGQFSKTLSPIFFRKGSTKNVPLFTSRADLDEELEREDGLEDRLQAVAVRGLLDDHRFTAAQLKALNLLLDRSWDFLSRAEEEADKILPPALPGAGQGDPGGHRKKAQRLVDDALKHLRCTEYWTYRVILHGEAKDEYVPVVGIGLAAGPAVPVFPAPPESELPPSPEDEDEDKPVKKKAAPKKSKAGYIVVGLGLLIAGVVYIPKLLKKKK